MKSKEFIGITCTHAWPSFPSNAMHNLSTAQLPCQAQNKSRSEIPRPQSTNFSPHLLHDTAALLWNLILHKLPSSLHNSGAGQAWCKHFWTGYLQIRESARELMGALRLHYLATWSHMMLIYYTELRLTLTNHFQLEPLSSQDWSLVWIISIKIKISLFEILKKTALS